MGPAGSPTFPPGPGIAEARPQVRGGQAANRWLTAGAQARASGPGSAGDAQAVSMAPTLLPGPWIRPRVAVPKGVASAPWLGGRPAMRRGRQGGPDDGPVAAAAPRKPRSG